MLIVTQERRLSTNDVINEINITKGCIHFFINDCYEFQFKTYLHDLNLII